MTRTLCARLDNAGDVLLCGPAVRAVAAGSGHVTFLAGPRGGEAAWLLPGVDEVVVWEAPWVGFDPPPVDREDIAGVVGRLGGFDRAVVFTSFHQSPLPAALLLRLAGVGQIAAISVDYPGSLLDVRHRVDEDIPEPERALSLAAAAGFVLPGGDEGRLAVRRPLPIFDAVRGRYVVVHPGVSVPARAWPAGHHAETVRGLAARGWQVVVTGGPGERDLTARVAGDHGLDLGGRTSLAELAAVVDGASALVAANTGPVHLAAAVDTPVVCLFAPVVPAVRWGPYRVRHILLGDQGAPCRDTRARHCPVPGHPCLTTTTPDEVVAAVERIASPVRAERLPEPG
jgi:ADP-heptose:LPS heptosyltransferase